MKQPGVVRRAPAPGLAELAESAESELRRSGFRLTFPAPLEARYRDDITDERLREMRFIAFWGVALYFVFGVLLNLTIIPSPNWPGVAIQLGGGSLVTLAIIHFALRRSVAMMRREAAFLVCALTCSVGAILIVATKPTPATLRDFLQAIPPATFILVFVRLRFQHSAIFFLINIAVFGASLLLRSEIGHDDAGFLIGFMTTLLLPALVGGHAFERISRRNYLLGLLERLRIEALEKQNVALTGLSYTDPLTGIANRRRLDEALWESVTAQGAAGALLLIDIDLFKAFNDRYGHLAGDACLCHVAKCLSAHVRSVDLLARFGGEEFAVLLPDAGLEAAAGTAERLRQAIQGLHFPIQSRQANVTISVGVAAREGLTTADALIGAADAALYEAKRAGRNRVQIAQAEVIDLDKRSA